MISRGNTAVTKLGNPVYEKGQLHMQLSRSFIFSYGSSMCTVWATGIVGKSFPLLRKTAFRLNFEEPMNNRQSSGLCPCPGVLNSTSTRCSGNNKYKEPSFVLVTDSEHKVEVISLLYDRHYCSLSRLESELITNVAKHIAVINSPT
jgi:hypothetical protein